MKNDILLQQQASDWLAAMNSDQVTDAEREQFMAWLGANPQHAEAYTQADSVWADIADISALKELEPLHQAPARVDRNSEVAGWFQGVQQFFTRPAYLTGIAAVALVAAIILFNPNLYSPYPEVQQYSTQTAEIRVIDLADGSKLTLGAKSSVEVSFAEKARHIKLTSGQAFFTVAKDPSRAFTVEVGNTQIQVLGTSFDVREAANNVYVAVTEGAVRVALANSSQQQRLEAGQATVAIAGDALQPVKDIPIDKMGGWREGRLIYNDSPIAEVVADANRYYHRTIRLAAGNNLDTFTITASFRTDQIEQMLNNLTVTYPVEIVDIPGGDLVIKARR